MLQKIRGIVLNTINYNDKYILVQIYTNVGGKVTYMVPKVTGKTSKLPRSLFSPLNVLDIEAEHRTTRDIQRIREAHLSFPLYSIPSDLVKTSVAFFLSEFLSKVLRDINENNYLFDYIVDSIKVLELADKNVSNFHLVFTLKLSYFLGFSPNLADYKEGQIFDMLNGVFVDKQPLHRYFVPAYESQALARLSRITYENMHLFKFSRQERVDIINRIIEYYRIHLYEFQPIKSLEVLHELF